MRRDQKTHALITRSMMLQKLKFVLAKLFNKHMANLQAKYSNTGSRLACLVHLPQARVFLLTWRYFSKLFLIVLLACDLKKVACLVLTFDRALPNLSCFQLMTPSLRKKPMVKVLNLSIMQNLCSWQGVPGSRLRAGRQWIRL